MNAEAVLPPDEHYRVRCAFLRFQVALDNLEQEFKPLHDDLSVECRLALETTGKIARSFFKRANAEVFGNAGISTNLERL